MIRPLTLDAYTNNADITLLSYKFKQSLFLFRGFFMFNAANSITLQNYVFFTECKVPIFFVSGFKNGFKICEFVYLVRIKYFV